LQCYFGETEQNKKLTDNTLYATFLQVYVRTTAPNPSLQVAAVWPNACLCPSTCKR